MPKASRVRLRVFVRATLRWAATVLIVSSIIASFDFLNLQDHSRAWSRDIFYRLWAPMYPVPSKKAVSVIMVDDRTLIKEGDHFPLKYETHARVLERILARKPKALFVDFAFMDARDDPTLGRLLDVLRQYGSDGVPVYLPIFATDTSDGLRREFRQLARDGYIRLVSFEFGRPLLGDYVYGLRQGDLDTVAFRIFRDFHPDSATRLADREEFEIWWGLPPDPLNCGGGRKACAGDPGSLWERITSVGQFEIGGAKVFSAPEGVSAPYNPTIYAEDLAHGDDEELAQRVIADRFVFYGAHRSLGADLHPNPVYTYDNERRQIPGVFIHAMALENLIDLREEVKKPSPSSRTRQWIDDVVAILFIVVGISALRIFAYIAMPKARLRRWVEYCVVALLALCFAFIAFYLCDRGASNWAGVFALMAISSEWSWAHGRIHAAFRTAKRWVSPKLFIGKGGS